MKKKTLAVGKVKKVLKSGIAVVCRDCGHHEQVRDNAFYSKFQPRCSVCGGGVDRVHEPARMNTISTRQLIREIGPSYNSDPLNNSKPTKRRKKPINVNSIPCEGCGQTAKLGKRLCGPCERHAFE